MGTDKRLEDRDMRGWAFAFGKSAPWIEDLGELEEFLREHPCGDTWWEERKFDRVVATGAWEAVAACAPDPDEVESLFAVLDAPRGTLTSKVRRFLPDANVPFVRPRYLAASLGDALDEFDRAAVAESTWAPEGMRYHMEMLVAGLECVATSLRDAVRICRMHPANRYWAFGREFDRGVFENLSDLIDEDDTCVDEVLALVDALEPPIGSDTWILLTTRLEEIAPPCTSWKDLAQVHPWLADAHWSAAKEEGAPMAGASDGGCDRDGSTVDGAARSVNKNMILDEAPRGLLLDAMTTEPGGLVRPIASASGSVRVASASEPGGSDSRRAPTDNGADAGRVGRPGRRRKVLARLGVAALVLVIAAVAFTGYVRQQEQREREEHEAYMASLERLDRGELEAAMAANAEVNEAFIRAELTDGQRADALEEDVEVLSIDLEDGELVSGWVNAMCTVRGLESGTVYEVDLGLRDDGVVEHVFGYMVTDESSDV